MTLEELIEKIKFIEELANDILKKEIKTPIDSENLKHYTQQLIFAEVKLLRMEFSILSDNLTKRQGL